MTKSRMKEIEDTINSHNYDEHNADTFGTINVNIELNNSLFPVIAEEITNNLVNLNSGTGTVDNPLEIEFNNISDDKADSLLSDIKNLNTKINSLENKNGYTFVNTTILKDSIGMLNSLASLSLSGIILNTFGRKKNKK